MSFGNITSSQAEIGPVTDRNMRSRHCGMHVNPMDFVRGTALMRTSAHSARTTEYLLVPEICDHIYSPNQHGNSTKIDKRRQASKRLHKREWMQKY